jgi:Tol biopolymer transport system component
MRTLLRPRAVLTMGALAMAVGLSAVPAAHAAFPGSNGRILFTSNLAGGLSELYTVKPDGSKRKRLTRNNAGDGEGAYSPSGNKIAFVRGVRRGAEIWTMNANGTGKRRVTHNTFADASPAWSPDGRRLVFRSTRQIAPDVEPNSDIWVINTDGTGETRLTSAPSQGDDDPVFSPDGTRIAYRSLRGDQSDIYVMNADGTNQIALTTDPANDFDVDWAPSGLRLVFVSDRNRNNEIYLMNADGSGQKRLTRTPRAGEAVPVFSPSGTRIAFARRLLSASGDITRADDVFVMRSSGKRTKRLTFSRDADGRPDWQARG